MSPTPTGSPKAGTNFGDVRFDSRDGNTTLMREEQADVLRCSIVLYGDLFVSVFRMPVCGFSFAFTLILMPR